jgi:acid stress-induced BolA-like protein IbaG/YrbA
LKRSSAKVVNIPNNRYKERMSSHPTTFKGSVTDAIGAAVASKIDGAQLEVTGGGGHYSIVVVSELFANKGTLERHRLVYGAIAHLMAGDMAPVHAVDSLVTRTPE